MPRNQCEILRSSRDGIGWLTISNPAKANAIDAHGWAELASGMAVFDADPAIRVVAIAGAGERVFISGADMTSLSSPDGSHLLAYEEQADIGRGRLTSCAKPIVAVINGICAGAGLEIALRCDIRIASSAAEFSIRVARLGNALNLDFVRVLLDSVARTHAMDMMITGRNVPAQEAHGWGMVNQVVEPLELQIHAERYLGTIADNAPLSVQASKAQTHEMSTSRGRAADYPRLTALISNCRQSRDYREGLQAFREKRQPLFLGT